MKERVLLPIETAQLAAVERYRRRGGFANRSATIRHLIDRGLTAAEPLAVTIKTLRELRPVLREKGVARAGVFGSVARGDQAPGSDIDVVLHLDPDRLPDLIGFLQVRDAVADAIAKETGRHVDVVERESVRSALAAAIDVEAVYAF